MNTFNTKVIGVVAAALVRGDGRVLIMQRLPGTHMAGRWEFPGGKLERDEPVRDALARELHEELGVVPVRARPLVRIRHDYPQRRVLLDCWRVDRWTGDVTAREGHPLAWVAPAELPTHDILEADRPMVTALRLPPRYAITADARPAELLASLTRLIDGGHALIQLRAPSLSDAEYDAVARDAIATCRARGATLLLNAAADTAAALDADGIHLTAARVRALHDRPLPPGRWVAASCHDEAELARACRVGCDFAVLGPVRSTRSHAHVDPLGWQRFGELADCAGLPVYALGGMRDADADSAWAHHGQGIAGISAWR